MFLEKIFKTIGCLFIFLALTLLWQRNNPNRIRFNSLPQSKEIAYLSEKNIPTQLIIKKLSIDLAIYPAKINKQRWETTTQGVSWLASTPLPGEKGNSVIYGHNWLNLLGNILFIKPGNQIEIIFQDGSRKTFIAERSAIVSPSNVSVLNQSDDKKITLYTCIGLFDEKRFVVVSKLQEI